MVGLDQQERDMASTKQLKHELECKSAQLALYLKRLERIKARKLAELTRVEQALKALGGGK